MFAAASMNVFWLVTCLTLLRQSCEAARILAFQVHGARSHSIVVEPLFEELAARGHQLTLITGFPHNPPLPNLHEIDISSTLQVFNQGLTMKGIDEYFRNPFITAYFMQQFDLAICSGVLSYPDVQRLFRSEETFDLVITELFGCDCFSVFAQRFRAPVVSIITSSVLPWTSDRVGLPDNPSYIPNYLEGFSADMNLYQRVHNSIVLAWSKLLHTYVTLPGTDRLVRTLLDPSFLSTESVIRNTSLMLVNSHYSISQSRPFPPNVVEIGGIHIRQSATPLTQDLKDILDNSRDGVIIVSFGSLVNVSSIPSQTMLMFMKVFSSLPQTFLLKCEGSIPDVPPNVLIRKWFPQRQIIEHPNVKLVIGHGGLASTIEVVHFGKPFIGVPFFADQFYNVMGIVNKGAGLILDVKNLSEQKINGSIAEILTNPLYTDNARRLSLQFRDRPMTALQTAVYWTEYVIRHQGAPHLRPASVDLPLYQYLLLDVVAVLSLPLLPIFYLVYFLFFRAVEVSPNDYRNYIINKKED